MGETNQEKNKNRSVNGTSDSSAQRIRHRQRTIKSFEIEARGKRTFAEKLADWFTEKFGSVGFLILNALLFFVWIVVNTNLFPLKPFDPYPFGLLTTIVSLEAIFLSIFVLMSHRRQSQVNDLREEVDLQVNLISEEEITKTLNLLARIYRHLNIPEKKDPELERMMRPLNTKEIEDQLRGQLNIKKQ